jgi:hypothetical protein
MCRKGRNNGIGETERKKKGREQRTKEVRKERKEGGKETFSLN